MSLDLELSPDDLKSIQRDTLQYFDLNGLSRATFAGYERVAQLNFSPLQAGGADAEKKLIDRLHRNLRILSNELDRAEALIRKGDPAHFPHSSSSPIPVWPTRERKRSKRARLPHRPVNTSPKTRKKPKPEERPSESEKKKYGIEVARYDDELRHIGKAARGKQRYDEQAAREEFPECSLWKALDNSRVSDATRELIFLNAHQQFGTKDGRMNLIGKLMGVSATTAYDYYKARPNRPRKRKRE